MIVKDTGLIINCLISLSPTTEGKHFNIEAFSKRNLEINTEAAKMQEFFTKL